MWKPIADRWVLVFEIAAATAGCTNAPPPDLPELETELPGPPELKPAVVDQVEFRLLSEEGEEIEEIEQSTPFRMALRFRLVEPPDPWLKMADVQLVVVSKGDTVICWQNVGPLIFEGDDVYRYEGELKSSPYSRQHFVRVRLLGDNEFIVEKPLRVR
jgi:hypothetical protein